VKRSAVEGFWKTFPSQPFGAGAPRDGTPVNPLWAGEITIRKFETERTV